MRRDEIDGSSKNMKKMIIGSALIMLACGCASSKNSYTRESPLLTDNPYKYALIPSRTNGGIPDEDYAAKHKYPEVINMMHPPFMDAIQ